MKSSSDAAGIRLGDHTFADGLSPVSVDSLPFSISGGLLGRLLLVQARDFWTNPKGRIGIMGIKLDLRRARRQLQTAVEIAESDLPLPEEWERRTKLISQAPARTYMPMLGTALLARATSEWVDTLALKETSGPNAYSARGLSHEVLVPASVEHGFSIRTTGREPLNNQPFFRYNRVDEVERVRFPEAHRYLVECLRRVNDLSSDDAVSALAAFIRVGFDRALSETRATLEDVALGLLANTSAAETLLTEDAEGGKRAQAVTAAAFDVVYGPDRVRSLLVNDPSRHFPGDVQVLDPVGRAIVSAEVRAKPVPRTEVEQFARALAEARITRGIVVALAANQPALPVAELVEQLARQRGVLLTIITSLDDLLFTAFAWSPKPLPEVLAEFPRRVSERLGGIDADATTIRRWEELVQPETATTRSPADIFGLLDEAR
jgi:SacI restriction endonuclease